MLNDKDFLKEEKECASLLGMTLKEYRIYVKNSKIPTTKLNSNHKYDNKILKSLGLSVSDLKLRKD